MPSIDCSAARAEADIPSQVLYIRVVFDMLHQSLDDTGYILYHQDMIGKEIMKHLKQHGWVLDRIKGRNMTYYCTLKQEDNVYHFPDLPEVFIWEYWKRSLGDGCRSIKWSLGKWDLTGNIDAAACISLEYAVEVEPNIAFALMLRKRRGEKTQSEIADKLNISYQQYQQLENPRKANPTLRTIAKLQKIFDYQFVSF